jgi:hypothetical protein
MARWDAWRRVAGSERSDAPAAAPCGFACAQPQPPLTHLLTGSVERLAHRRAGVFHVRQHRGQL